MIHVKDVTNRGAIHEPYMFDLFSPPGVRFLGLVLFAALPPLAMQERADVVYCRTHAHGMHACMHTVLRPTEVYGLVSAVNARQLTLIVSRNCCGAS